MAKRCLRSSSRLDAGQDFIGHAGRLWRTRGRRLIPSQGPKYEREMCTDCVFRALSAGHRSVMRRHNKKARWWWLTRCRRCFPSTGENGLLYAEYLRHVRFLLSESSILGLAQYQKRLEDAAADQAAPAHDVADSSDAKHYPVIGRCLRVYIFGVPCCSHSNSRAIFVFLPYCYWRA